MNRHHLIRVIAVCAVVSILAPVTAAAGDGPTEFTDSGIPYYRVDQHTARFAQSLLFDYRTQVSFPLGLWREDPGRFLLGLGGIATLVVADPLTYDWLAPNAGDSSDPIVRASQKLSDFGNNRTALPLVLSFAAVGMVFDSPRERGTSVMLMESLITSATWTASLKWVTGRQRPRESDSDVSDWEGPDVLDEDSGGQKFRSFPSGHTTGIFAVATILSHQYPTHGIVPVLSYGTAAAMGYARMQVGAHWLSDVVVGGLIGYGCARQVIAAHKQPAGDEESRNLSIGLDLAGGYRGFNLTYRF